MGKEKMALQSVNQGLTFGYEGCDQVEQTSVREWAGVSFKNRPWS